MKPQLLGSHQVASKWLVQTSQPDTGEIDEAIFQVGEGYQWWVALEGLVGDWNFFFLTFPSNKTSATSLGKWMQRAKRVGSSPLAMQEKPLEF